MHALSLVVRSQIAQGRVFEPLEDLQTGMVVYTRSRVAAGEYSFSLMVLSWGLGQLQASSSRRDKLKHVRNARWLTSFPRSTRA